MHEVTNERRAQPTRHNVDGDAQGKQKVDLCALFSEGHSREVIQRLTAMVLVPVRALNVADEIGRAHV